MATTILAAATAGEGELVLDYNSATLDSFPMWLGVSAGMFSNMALDPNCDPALVRRAVVAGLVGGGASPEDARGITDRLSRVPGALLNQFASQAIKDALLAV